MTRVQEIVLQALIGIMASLCFAGAVYILSNHGNRWTESLKKYEMCGFTFMMVLCAVGFFFGCEERVKKSFGGKANTDKTTTSRVEDYFSRRARWLNENPSTPSSSSSDNSMNQPSAQAARIEDADGEPMHSYATIVAVKDFHAPLFAEKLGRALRAGDKEGISNVLSSISNNQRQLLREPYKLKYGKDLIEALDKKLGGDLEKAVFALMDTPLDYDVKQLKQAMKGLGTDEAVLIEILCSRTVDQLRAIRAAYEQQYGKALEADIAGDTSGEFRELLVSLVTGSKDGSHDTNDVNAKDDAVRLFADGKAKLTKKDGSHFLTILASQNQYQLRKVFAYFQELAGAPIEKVIEKEFSGDLAKSYLTIVKAASDKQKFFAQQLYASMKGLGTRDNDLIRVLVSRSEVDLELIKTEFQELYNKSLIDTVKGDTSGAYRDLLLGIINGNHGIAH